MYLTFAEYFKLGGTLDETAFDIYSFEANQKIKSATFDRITEPSEAVKKCMVRLIALAEKSDICSSQLSSYSHDGMTQTFNIPKQEEYAKKVREIIRAYLINEKAADGTPLLYCGVNYR